MQLQESGEMYLESIYMLSQTKGAVRSIDVCDYMGFSKPSVSRAIGLLKSGGFITVNEQGLLSLTEEGESVARRTVERHHLLTEFFTYLGVHEATAEADACKIEHHISNETIAALKLHLKNLKQG